AQAGARRCRRRGSPALLSGRLFDNRGTRMSPTPATKGGARYRYYVSQAVLQNKPPPSGLVSRVPAAEIEALVVAALRSHLSASSGGGQVPNNDRDLPARPLPRGAFAPNPLQLPPPPIIARPPPPPPSPPPPPPRARPPPPPHNPPRGAPARGRHAGAPPRPPPCPRRRQGHHPCPRAQHADQS